MKVLSLFSGVGGFDLGLERAGMQTVFQCEWDKHATKILERHWPDVPRWDDITTLTGRHILQHAPVIDIVAWGSPCQDLSVAGKRAGLEGSRSGLFHQGIRIINEIRKETNNAYPRISLWENVYGALNSNKGADFGVILDEMAEAGALVQEWRVLDAQYFGVPQRRRRVFLVSIFDSATAARCPDPLLPVSQSVRRDTETSGTQRQEPAGTTTQSLGSGSDIANTISASLYHHGTVVNQDANNGHVVVDNNFARPVGSAVLGSEIVGALNAVDYKWPQNQQLEENKFVPVETFTKSKRAQSATDNETWVEGKPAPTLNAFDQGDTRTTTVVVGEERTYRNVTGALLGRDSFGPNHEGARDGKLILESTAIVFENSYRDGIRIATEDVSQTLSAKMGTGGNNTPMVAQVFPIQDGRDIDKHQNGLGIGQEGAPSYTLDQTGAQSVAYGIQGNVIGRQDHNGPAGKGHTDEGDPMYTLTSTDIHAVAFTTEQTPKWNDNQALTLTGGSPSGGGQPQAVFQYDGYNQRIYQDDVSVTIRIGRDSSDFVAQPAQATMAVRRLTPIECERLMGWPDNWTEGQADTHRYKQCGNGVASPVATWIAHHLQQLDKDTHATQTTTTTTQIPGTPTPQTPPTHLR